MTLQVVSALAVAENAVGITFNEAIYWSGLLDPTDASQLQLYTFVPNATGPIGQDGTIARAVSAASVAQVGTDGTTIVVTLDRPMTPAPAQYAVVVSTLVQTADQSASLDPSHAQANYTSVFKKLVPPTLNPSSVATRDIASPVGTQSAQAALVPYPANLLQLGVPVLDDTGDYATDIGLVGLKKRILRRILFTPGATLYLGNSFGAGALGYGKKLASGANRAALTGAVESQIAQDPEVAAVSAQVQFSNTSGLFYLSVLVQSRNSGTGFKLLVPVQQSQSG